MADTDFGALTTSQKKVWSARVWIEGREKSFWFSNGFVSSGIDDSSKPVHLVNELTPTERGDKCVMPIVYDLQSDGVVGDMELEGREETLVNSDIQIEIDQLRNGVKSRGRLSEQRTVIRFRVQAKDKLGFWLANRIDELGFLTTSGISYANNLDGSTRVNSNLPQLQFAADVSAPTSARTKFPGTVTSTGSLTTSNTMSWNFCVQLRAYAERKRIKPVNLGAKSYYCIVMSPEQARDLKQDTNYQTNVGRAAERGDKNPLFSGAFAVVDGLMLYSHNKVYRTFGLASGSKWGAGGTVDGAQALLLGAQALGFARVGEPQWAEASLQDYGNKEGAAYGRFIGFRKPVFKATVDGMTNQDFSVISAYTASAQ